MIDKGRQPGPFDAIEELGVGPVQWRVAILCGLLSFSTGAETLVFSSVNDAFKQEWNLSASQCGALASVVYLGVLLGNLLGGFVGDRYGRKPPIVVSSGATFVLCNLSLLSTGFWSLVSFLLLIGMAFGLGLPVQTTMVSETTPGTWRIAFTVVTIAFFSVGEIYSGILLMLDDPTLVNLHWRVVVTGVAAPCVAFVPLIAFFLYQSPVYLASRGEHEEANRILELMRVENGVSNAKFTLTPGRTSRKPTQVTLGRQLSAIFGHRLCFTTCIACYASLVMNLSYYGSLYAFPKIMVSRVDGGSRASPALSLLLGGVAELAGYLVVVLCIRLPRIHLMSAVFALQGLCLAAFAASGDNHRFASEALEFCGYHGTKLCSSIAFVVVYVYAAEVYPTMARALGGSFVAGSGRVGAILGPPVVELVVSLWSFDVFFLVASLLSIGAVPLLLLLPYETKGRGLLDDDGGKVDGPYGAADDGA